MLRKFWLPRSLAGRVFGLFAVVLAIFAAGGLGMFFRFVYSVDLTDVQLRGASLMSLIAPTITDSAVIGDYDTIRHTLNRAVDHSDFSTATFIDLKGGSITTQRRGAPEVSAPAFLQEYIAETLFDENRPIVVGGHDYGVLRLHFAADQIAGEIWRKTRAMLILAAVALSVGLLAFRMALKNWLGNLEHIESLEAEMRAGIVSARTGLAEDAPIELKRTFDVVNRAAVNVQILDVRLQEELRSRAAALAALRGVLEGLVTQPVAHAQASSGDIEAISLMISELVQRLHEHGEQLKAIFMLSPDGFVSFDGQRKVSYVSPGFARLTGLGVEEVAGQDEQRVAALLAARCAGGLNAMPNFDTLRQGETQESGGRRLLVDIERPTRRTLQVTLRSGHGTISQMLHLRDVTHETEVDQMKSEFLSTAAHELRTPMANIYGFAELMMRRRLSPEKQQDVIATVHRQTGLMISIVNELLDLARIEARRGKDFDIERIDLCELVHAVVRDFKPPQDRGAPVLALPASPLPVRVDRSKMAQALGNVLSNAYKYSPDGGDVHMGVLFDPAGATLSARRIGLCVRDQGIGIAPEHLARVSERFFRADASGNIPGTGLGMSIVKEIVELLGGALELQSTLGQGTQVILWLPTVQAGGEAHTSATAAAAAMADAV
jgi:signal transduction histidine kinase